MEIIVIAESGPHGALRKAAKDTIKMVKSGVEKVKDNSHHLAWIIPLLGTVGLSLALSLTGALNLHTVGGRTALISLLGAGEILTMAGGALTYKMAQVNAEKEIEKFENKTLMGLGIVMLFAGVVFGGAIIACAIRPELLNGLSHGLKHAIQHSDDVKKFIRLVAGSLGAIVLGGGLLVGSAVIRKARENLKEIEEEQSRDVSISNPYNFQHIKDGNQEKISIEEKRRMQQYLNDLFLPIIEEKLLEGIKDTSNSNTNCSERNWSNRTTTYHTLGKEETITHDDSSGGSSKKTKAEEDEKYGNFLDNLAVGELAEYPSTDDATDD